MYEQNSIVKKEAGFLLRDAHERNSIVKDKRELKKRDFTYEVHTSIDAMRWISPRPMMTGLNHGSVCE